MRTPEAAHWITFELWSAGHFTADHEPHDPGYAAAEKVVANTLRERGTALDADLLREAALDVEAGYINQPARLTPTYWRKIAKRYAYLAALRSQRD